VVVVAWLLLLGATRPQADQSGLESRQGEGTFLQNA